MKEDDRNPAPVNDPLGEIATRIVLMALEMEFAEFLGIANRSNVPAEFGEAILYRKRTLSQPGRPASYSLIAESLVGRRFSETESRYVLALGGAIGAAKRLQECRVNFDSDQGRVRQAEDKIKRVKSGLTEVLRCEPEDLATWLKKIGFGNTAAGIQEIEDGLAKIQGDLKAQEQKLSGLKTSTQLAFFIAKDEESRIKKPSRREEIRQYLEDFFADSQKRARIILLAS